MNNTNMTSMKSDRKLSQTIITDDILAGVGKKLRSNYLSGGVSAAKIMETYMANMKELENFPFFGLNIFDMIRLEKETHNPLLKKKIQAEIEKHKEKSRCSNSQNKLSLEKFKSFRTDALGIGLHAVVAFMRRIVKQFNRLEDLIVLTLLETEFANLSAKQKPRFKEVIYKRKAILLERLSYLLDDTDWKYGISYNTGKNAPYIVYIYLPTGVQLSWHCNEYRLMYYYHEIECEWDGQACMTMEKILSYISEHYNIGCSRKRVDRIVQIEHCP